MKKVFSEMNIIIILAVLNILISANNLMDYKTDRLIDTSVDILPAKYIYKR